MDLRILRRLAISGFVLGFGGGLARSQTFVKPGYSDVLNWPFEIDSESVSPASGVQVSVRVEPESMARYFSVDSSKSVLGPADIPPGGQQTFSVKYAIAQGAPDGGTFNVFLLASMTTEGALATVGTQDDDGSIRSVGTSFKISSDSAPPTITLRTQDDAPIADGIWSNAKDLRVAVDDTVLPDGSPAPSVTGPGNLQLWAGQPQTGTLLGSNSEKFPDKHLYSALDAGLAALSGVPEDRLIVVAADQAGNLAPDYSVLIDKTLPVFTARAGNSAITSGSDLGIGPVTIFASDLPSVAAEKSGIGASGLAWVRLRRTDGSNFDQRKDFAPDDPTGGPRNVVFPLSGGGTLPTGTFLAEVADRAGNVSSLSFHLHARPPRVEVDLDNGMEVSYEGVDVGQFKTPSHGLTFHFAGDEGLTSAVITRNGQAIFTFNSDGTKPPPTFTVPEGADGNVPEGRYAFTAVDVEGRVGSGALTKYTYSLAANTEQTTATFGQGGFSVHLVVDAASDSGEGVGTVELYHAQGDGPTFAAGPRVVSRAGGNAPFTQVIAEDVPVDNYVAVSRDSWNNVVQQAISLKQVVGRLNDFFGAGTFTNTTSSPPDSPAGGLLALVSRSHFPTTYQPQGTYESPVFDLHTPQQPLTGKDPEIFAPVPVIGQALLAPPPLIVSVAGFTNSAGISQGVLPLGVTLGGDSFGRSTGVSVTEELATSDDPSGGDFITAQEVKVNYANDTLVAASAGGVALPPRLGRYIKERLTLTSNNVGIAPSNDDPKTFNTPAFAVSPVVEHLSASPLFASVLTLQGALAIWSAQSQELVRGKPRFEAQSPIPNPSVEKVIRPEDVTLVRNTMREGFEPVQNSAHNVDPTVGLGPIIVTLRLEPSDYAGLDPDTLAIWAAPPGKELTPLATTFDPENNVLQASMSGFYLNTLFVAFARPLPAEAAPTAKGLAIAADPQGKLWEVGSDSDTVWLGRYGPGGLEARTRLLGAVDDGAWTIRFDEAGNTYAIGSTPSDLAVYAVSPAAVPLSSATFHDVGGAKATAWDASDELWITGALQRGSPADGSLSLKMGLWKYAPATGLLALTTTYTRGGPADAGFGVRVLGDQVFVEGYTSTSPLSSPSLGLALWAFDAAGHGPVAGPFIRPGYLSKLDAGVNARLEVSSGGLYAFAPRTGAGGQNDLGFIRYGSDGKALAERVFSAGQGADLLPQAVTLDGQGHLAVAVQAEANGSKSFGVARYGPDGSFLGATSESASLGGVSGIAALGSDLWLAVDGSSVPHRFAGTAPFAGLDVLISSAPVDETPPVSTAAVAGPSFQDPAGDLYVSSRTGVSLAAFDPPEADGSAGSGLDRIEVSVDSGPVAVYVSTLSFAEGAHALAFRAVDKAGNAEPPRLLALRSDATPPETTLEVSGPRAFAEGGGFYASTSSVIAFHGVDPVSSGVASGLASAQWQDNSGPWQVSGSTSLPEGVHALGYHSADNVENLELAKLTTAYVDATAPVTSVQIGQPQAAAPDGLVVSALTPITLAAADPVAAGVAAGVDRTQYAVGGGSWTVYAGSFTLSVPDGPTPLSFFSADRVGNAEAPKSMTVVMDAAPPALAFLSPAACDGGICRVVQGRVPVFASVSDAHLSSWTLTSAGVVVATGASGASGLVGTLDAAGVSGAFALELAARDAVGNASSSALALWAGDPGRLLVLGEHGALQHPEGVAWAGGKLYVADTGDQQIKVYDSSGTFLAAYGKRGRRIEPYFNSPRGVAADAAGNIYVADTNHHRVAKLSPDGALLWSAGASELRNGVRHFRPGAGPGEFQHPSGVALGPDGVYVADTDNRRVQVLDASGAFLRQFSLPSAVGASGRGRHGDHDEDKESRARTSGKPVGIAVDAAGEIFIADEEGRRALKLDGQGQVLLSIPGFTRPEGMAVTPDGRCWLVSDRERGVVSKFDGAGNPTLEFGGAALKEPVGLGLTAEGLLLVADRGKEQVQGFGVPGPAPLIASGGPAEGRKDADEEDDEVVASTITRAEGGVIVNPDKAAVRLPPNALPDDEELTVSRVEKADPDAERKKAEAERAGLAAVAPAVEFGPEGLQFAAPVTISLPYDPQQLANGGASEQSLQVNYWNPKTKEWEPLVSRVDPVQHVVIAQTRHFSQYQVLAPAAALAPQASASTTVDTVQAACNPLRHDCRPMAFRNLPAGARLRLYTLAGNLVKDFSADGSGTATWDGTNQDGQPAASGVYLLYAQGAGGKKLLKVAVQR